MLFDDGYFYHIAKKIAYRNVVFLDGHLSKFFDQSNSGVDPHKTEFYHYWFYHTVDGSFDVRYPGS